MSSLQLTTAMTVVMLMLTGAGASSVGAQQFEVASVKPSNPHPSSPALGMPAMSTPGGGRLAARNMTLLLLVRSAYSLPEYLILGWPSWRASEKFDITAQADASVLRTAADLAPLLRSLLAERFMLRAHMETREMPVSVLTVARGDHGLGPDLKPSHSDCGNAQAELQQRAEAALKGGKDGAAAAMGMLPKPGEFRKCAISPRSGADPADAGVHADGQPMSAIVRLIERTSNTTVIDETGLSGLFDWDLRLDLTALSAPIQATSGANETQDPGMAAASSLGAAVREQLGLAITPAKRPVQVLVIDSVTLPTPD